MSKAVMLSIQPKWCEKIASGEKTVEVRKTAPKIATPFKCYIYCTADNIDLVPSRIWWKADKTGFQHILNRKVIGEFTCDRITTLFNICTDDWQYLLGETHEWHKQLVEQACLSEAELKDYANGNRCYAWHISDLVIYDKPKLLSEFVRDKALCYDDWLYGVYSGGSGSKGNYNSYLNPFRIKRPPQSWCYVQEV